MSSSPYLKLLSDKKSIVSQVQPILSSVISFREVFTYIKFLSSHTELQLFVYHSPLPTILISDRLKIINSRTNFSHFTIPNTSPGTEQVISKDLVNKWTNKWPNKIITNEQINTTCTIIPKSYLRQVRKAYCLLLRQKFRYLKSSLKTPPKSIFSMLSLLPVLSTTLTEHKFVLFEPSLCTYLD